MPAARVSWEKLLSKPKWVISHCEDGDLPNIWHYLFFEALVLFEESLTWFLLLFPLEGLMPSFQIV